jgi:hypothetical protein
MDSTDGEVVQQDLSMLQEYRVFPVQYEVIDRINFRRSAISSFPLSTFFAAFKPVSCQQYLFLF